MQKLRVTEMGRLTVDEYRQSEKTPLVVVLDNVRSRHNVGAVFRTADAFRLSGVVLCGISCCPPDVEIHKTALGAELTVDWQYEADTLTAVERLHQEGYRVYAVEQAHGSTVLQQFKADVSSKIAIVLGHEVKGVSQEVVDACDGCIEIPQYGTKHSLNVSVAAGIVMYQLSDLLRVDRNDIQS
ncbi:MAG: RNA methyltransferase [Paludibacteraceae bacterium]|nr:RNA methyltransferase [Paludibacteraceae bacterium]